MSRDTHLDVINVIDLEATIWEKDPPPGEVQEVIEIGLAEYQVKTGNVLSAVSIPVRPDEGSISPFCTAMTGITPESRSTLLPGVMGFTEACRHLERAFASRFRVFASYGDFDRRLMERECARRNLRYPFDITHLNIKNLFALKCKLTAEVMLDEAITLAGLTFHGTHHHGVDDAINAAHLLRFCLHP